MANEFGIALKKARERKGVTLAALAKHLGVSGPYLHDVEAGRRSPLTDERAALAAELLESSYLTTLAATGRKKLDLSDLTSRQRVDVVTLVAKLRAGST